MLKFFFNKSYYLGFLLASYLAYGSFASSGSHIEALRTVFQRQSSIQSVNQINQALQRTMAVTSTAVVINNFSLFNQSLGEFKGRLSEFEKNGPQGTELYKKALPRLKQVSQQLGAVGAQMRARIEPSAALLNQNIQLMEEARKSLDEGLQNQWQAFLIEQKEVIAKQQENSVFQRVGQLALSVFLFVLMFMSVRKERAERMVRASDNLHRMLFSSLSEGVLLCMPDGRIAAANESAGRILGHKSRNLLNYKLQDILPLVYSEEGKALKKHSSPFERLLKSEESHRNMLLGIFRPDGDERWLSMSSQPVHDAELRDLMSTVISFSDVTKRVQAQKVVEDQQAQIVNSAKLAELGEMAGGIAHEINNPLAIISAQAEILQMSAAKDNIDKEQAIKTSQKISSTAMRIAKIVKGMLTFARDGSNDPMKKIDIKELIDEAVEMSRAKLARTGIELTVGEVPENLQVECRSVQLIQVLMNLLSNAKDAVITHQEKWIRLEVVELEDLVEISVTDSGQGISREIQEKIFQPFFTTKEVGAGTGLGMSISLGIVEDHGGRLIVDEKSPNTRFVMLLPKIHFDVKLPGEEENLKSTPPKAQKAS